ncbi:phosphatidic acid phosphatase type 2/haloperoxidase [Cercophora newfieldiana]|uniref:Phosphatidic acid phosphatase type 2/haloperoxidase n=1 Tax=Cercophora newfieldiana TaxID=92897 RepID=A0AA40CIK8_9PEZI|nr:phosphatidic acid phosphatase type 2/haloperoxidase [Cercophora newfieldiana]
MGIFTRRTRNAPAPAVSSRRARRSRGLEPYTMASRPSFGQWLKATWLDIFTMIVLGAIGLGVYFAKPAPTRSFPVTFSDGEVVWPSVAYPLRREIIPIWLAAFLAAMVPIVVILFCQVRIRSFWDVNNAILGLLYSLITAAVFQVFVKWLIGGLRPHFLDVCKPDLSLVSNAPGAFGAGLNGKGFNGIFYTREICTGDEKEINDSLESMPSGHSTAAFAGFVFLSLYLNGKLKVFSNYHPSMWKLAAVYAPILGAVLIAGALTIDEFHHFHDILAGGIIGTVMAFSAYRMTYASVWDWRWNHIPLNRSVPFDFMAGHELSGATFTRSAAWGSGDRHGNASGDSHGRRSWNGTRKEVPVQGGGTGVPVAHTRPTGDQMV